VGDIEALPYIGAVRQLRWELGSRCVSLHLTLVPFLRATGELKTKPTQHSVKMLQEAGVQPDILVCRAEHSLGEDVRRKLALFCNVALDSVFESLDARTIYEVPMLLRDQSMDQVVLRKLGLSSERQPELAKWESFVHKLLHPEREVRIGLIGKYVELKDSYKSINEALIHAGAEHSAKVDIQWIHSEELTPENAASHLVGLHGVLVAPGFGARGFEGKIEAVRIAREHGIPFFWYLLWNASRRYRVRQKCTGTSKRQFNRGRSQHAASRYCPYGGAEGRNREGWDHAPWFLRLPA